MQLQMFLPLLVVISAQIISAQFSIHFDVPVVVRGLCFRDLFIYNASPPPVHWFLGVKKQL